MKKAVAQKKHQSSKIRSVKSTKQSAKSGKAKAGKVLKLKIPKKRQISIRRSLVAAVFIALLIWAVYPLKQRAQQKRETQLLQAKIASLKAKNSGLENEIKRLNSDEYVEQLARRYFGLVKPGESSVLVVPPKPGQSQDVQGPQQGQKEQPKDQSQTAQKVKEAQKVGSKPPTKSSKGQNNSSKSLWGRILDYLDNLTGQENR